jgi:dolichyl-phosphate-mannose-protein mannosyltransferase
MTRSRVVLAALLAVLALDLLVVVVTGSTSILPGLSPVGAAGFAARAAATGVLLAALWRRDRARLALVLLLLLPLLVQFQIAGRRLSGDGVMYYVYVRSLVKDKDVDFTNEYTHYELIGRGDLSVPTKTGLRRSIFSVGPGLVSIPFFLLGEAVARVESWMGRSVDLSGYGPEHVNAVALGGLVFGFVAVLLIHGLLRRHFSSGTALGGALLVGAATFLPWYMVQQPTMSHAASTAAAALALWLWDRDRAARSPRGYVVLGLVLGLAMCIRWQNGVLLVLPGIDLLAAWHRGRGPWWRYTTSAAGLVGGALLGAFPQMLAWKALYGMWVLPYPPHGADFVRLDHPFLMNALFSSRHGLLSWTPVLWGGYLGFVPLMKRRPWLAGPLLVPLLLMTYVNACSGDWWAGGSFSNRRFDSLLPILAFGLAATIDAARAALAARPQAALGLLALPVVLWNVALMEQVRRGTVPRDDTVAFPRLVGGAARVLADAVGSPPTWPASWLFAWRHHRPPSQYDLLVGRYLFYRQNNMGGHVEVGGPGAEDMLGEGWGPAQTVDGVRGRPVRGRARLFAGLDGPEELEMRLRVRAPAGTEVRVRVNGRDAGRFWAEPAWLEVRLRAGAAFWRRELNDVVLETAGDGVLVSAVDFVRVGGAAR